MYDPAPRGLASNNGFEAEDAARAERLAQNALNAAYHRAMDAMQSLFDTIYAQGKHTGMVSHKDYLLWAMQDADIIVRDRSKSGVLPTDGVNP